MKISENGSNHIPWPRGSLTRRRAGVHEFAQLDRLGLSSRISIDLDCLYDFVIVGSFFAGSLIQARVGKKHQFIERKREKNKGTERTVERGRSIRREEEGELANDTESIQRWRAKCIICLRMLFSIAPD